MIIIVLYYMFVFINSTGNKCLFWYNSGFYYVFLHVLLLKYWYSKKKNPILKLFSNISLKCKFWTYQETRHLTVSITESTKNMNIHDAYRKVNYLSNFACVPWISYQ